MKVPQLRSILVYFLVERLHIYLLFFAPCHGCRDIESSLKDLRIFHMLLLLFDIQNLRCCRNGRMSIMFKVRSFSLENSNSDRYARLLWTTYYAVVAPNCWYWCRNKRIKCIVSDMNSILSGIWSPRGIGVGWGITRSSIKGLFGGTPLPELVEQELKNEELGKRWFASPQISWSRRKSVLCNRTQPQHWGDCCEVAHKAGCSGKSPPPRDYQFLLKN